MSSMPANWTIASLGEIATEPITQEGPEQGAFTYVDISSIDKQTKRIVSPQKLESTTAPSRAKQQLRSNDVLVSMTRPNLNAVARVPEELNGSIGSTGFCVLRSSYASPRWLEYRVQAHDFIDEMSALVQGALYPAVRPKDVLGFRTLLPPREEQDRIAAEIEKQFTRLDDAVAALKRVQANLKRYRASVLKAACEGRLVPTEAELARKEGRSYEPASKLLNRILAERRAKWEADQLQKMIAAGKPAKDQDWKKKYKQPAPPNTIGMPELPEGWAWASIDQLTAEEDYALAIGPFGSNLKVSDYTSHGVPLVFVKNIRAQDFSDASARFTSNVKAEQLRPHQVNPGDLLVTKMGDPPGDVCIYPEDRPAAVITADCIKIQLHPFLKSKAFFVFVIRSKVVQNQILVRTKGVAQLKVSLARFKDIAIPLAPLSEQQAIATEIDRRFSVADNTDSSLGLESQRAIRLRQAVLKNAFSGKLVPQDPNDEPASMLLERVRAERAALATNNGNQNATPEAGSAKGQRRRRIKKLAQGVSPGKG